MSRPVDQREHEQHRDRLYALGAAVAVERGLAVGPDDVLRRGRDLRVVLREQDVGELDRGRRQARRAARRGSRAGLLRAAATTAAAGAVRSGTARRPPARARARAGGASGRRCARSLPVLGVETLLQALDLLEDASRACPRCGRAGGPGGSCPGGRPGAGCARQVQHVAADLREGHRVLGRPAPAARRTSSGPRAPPWRSRSRLGVLVEAPDLLLRRCLLLRLSRIRVGTPPVTILNPWPSGIPKRGESSALARSSGASAS